MPACLCAGCILIGEPDTVLPEPQELECHDIRAGCLQGFDYVESLTWVFLHPNNTIAHLPSALCQSSHLTLFIFRRSGEPHAEGARALLERQITGFATPGI